MKKKLILLGILIALTFHGCQELLEEKNLRIPVADFYFKTEAGIKDATNAIYPFLKSWYGGLQILFLTDISDIFTHAHTGGIMFSSFTSELQPGHAAFAVWDQLYLGIAAANTVIGRAPAANMNETLRNNKMGEAYFLRAVFYHILVMQWGPVPLEIEETKEVRTVASRASEATVYAQIISDLGNAANLLPLSQTDYGRPTSWSAKAMLARIHLTVKNFTKASDYAKDVINNGPYKLVSDFATLWNIENEKNSEVIFAVQNTLDTRLNGTGNTTHLMYYPQYDKWPGMKRDIANGRPFNRMMPTRFFVDLMQADRNIDSRYDKAWKSVYYANNSANLLPECRLGDTAVYLEIYPISAAFKTVKSKKYTIYDINDFYSGELPKGIRINTPALNKHLDPRRLAINDMAGERDFFVIRLAEVYLIAAEAAAMKESPNLQEAAAMINVVRTRAAWPGKVANMQVSASKINLNYILDERAREFCGEMLRWDDLKRTGKLMERIKLYNPDARNNIKDYHLLRPIPTTMMDRITNKSEFLQNPGY